jgi:hypothetical protein
LCAQFCMMMLTAYPSFSVSSRFGVKDHTRAFSLLILRRSATKMSVLNDGFIFGIMMIR